MLALIGRRLNLSYNVLNLRNLHCRPAEQCQSFNQSNDESDHSKSAAASHLGSRCDGNLRDSNFKNDETVKTKSIILDRFGGECILSRYSKQKKRRYCNSSDINYHWNILKWTTGFLGSIYASKFMCLYARRRRNNREWRCMEQALDERHQIQKEALDKSFGISEYQKSTVPDDKHNYNYNWSEFAFSYQAIPVTNDHELKQTDKVTIGTQTIDAAHVTEPAHDVNTAIDGLKSTLGHGEFKLGIQSLKMQRPEVAVSHFTLASIHNHPEATYNLGICYEKGIGIGMNLKTAKECYRAAANLGHHKSMYNLGVFYARGMGGLKKNRKAARECFEEASRMGSMEAKMALGKRFVRLNENASRVLTVKSHQITSELNPAHRVGLSVVV